MSCIVHHLQFITRTHTPQKALIMYHISSHSQGQDTMTSWLKSGKISDCSTFVDGFENLPEGILGLFKGTNIGKMLVRVPLESTAGYGK